MTVSALARAEIRALRHYDTPSSVVDAVRMNTNEAPDSFDGSGLNRYPPTRPLELTEALATHYGVCPENVLVTRGSSEGIDLLVRAFCSPGKDRILITPPAFEMYRVYAAIQAADVIEAPLVAAQNFALDSDVLCEAVTPDCKLIFLCSPNNPSGTSIPQQQLVEVARATAGRAIVVIDEAYIEFSDAKSCTKLLAEFDHLVVLRTLSKGLALAGARCGCVIAAPELIGLLDAILPPYAVSTPAADQALQALAPSRIDATRAMITTIREERERMTAALRGSAHVDCVWPSDANFILVRFKQMVAIQQKLASAGIQVRIFREDELANCARVSIASRSANDQFLEAVCGGL